MKIPQKILVTGSSGHLGEALVRTLRPLGCEIVSADILEGPFTSHRGDIADAAFVNACMKGVEAVIHSATLHKPHVATHSRQAFIDVNITGALNLLEAAKREGVRAFVFTSTTSVFGHAMAPGEKEPAAWVTEDLAPQPKNIYGITKLAAENLCALFHEKYALPCIVLRTSRFFPEEDDSAAIREGYDDLNAKVNELLYRRVDIADAVDAHLCALSRAGDIGFGRYIVSATSPFVRGDIAELRRNAPEAVARYADYEAEYARRGWRMFAGIDRVYVNERARKDLAWEPEIDFAAALERLKRDESPFSALAADVGSKGYHDTVFEDGPFPVD